MVTVMMKEQEAKIAILKACPTASFLDSLSSDLLRFKKFWLKIISNRISILSPNRSGFQLRIYRTLLLGSKFYSQSQSSFPLARARRKCSHPLPPRDLVPPRQRISDGLFHGGCGGSDGSDIFLNGGGSGCGCGGLFLRSGAGDSVSGDRSRVWDVAAGVKVAEGGDGEGAGVAAAEEGWRDGGAGDPGTLPVPDLAGPDARPGDGNDGAHVRQGGDRGVAGHGARGVPRHPRAALARGPCPQPCHPPRHPGLVRRQQVPRCGAHPHAQDPRHAHPGLRDAVQRRRVGAVWCGGARHRAVAPISATSFVLQCKSF